MHDSINIIIQPHRYHQDSLPALSFTNKESFRPTYSQLGIATPFRDPPVFLSLSLSLPYILNSDHLPHLSMIRLYRAFRVRRSCRLKSSPVNLSSLETCPKIEADHDDDDDNDDGDLLFSHVFTWTFLFKVASRTSRPFSIAN